MNGLVRNGDLPEQARQIPSILSATVMLGLKGLNSEILRLAAHLPTIAPIDAPVIEKRSSRLIELMLAAGFLRRFIGLRFLLPFAGANRIFKDATILAVLRFYFYD